MTCLCLVCIDFDIGLLSGGVWSTDSVQIPLSSIRPRSPSHGHLRSFRTSSRLSVPRVLICRRLRRRRVHLTRWLSLPLVSELQMWCGMDSAITLFAGSKANNCFIERCGHFKTRSLLWGNCLQSISSWRRRSNFFNGHGMIIN